MEKNANNKVNRWSLELATYNITFEWISGAKNKAADCLSRLVKPILASTSVNMLTPHPNTSPQISQESTTTPKPLTVYRLDALLQMQRTDPFCKCISKKLLNGKAPHHKFDIFTHVKGLLYKHVTDAGKQFLTMVIPKSWKYTVLVEAHDKLGHQGDSCMYCLIK